MKETIIALLLLSTTLANSMTLDDAKRLLHKKILIPRYGQDYLFVETEIKEISPDGKFVNIAGFGWMQISKVVVVSEL